MSELLVHTVDAFTERPFGGNPAAVCVTPEPLDDALMQSIATEMNLSETAFVVGADGAYTLRWFTPACEVALCGHATLATARVLFDAYGLDAETARFQTRSGELRVGRDGDRLRMDFPADPPRPAELPPDWADALGCAPIEAFLVSPRLRMAMAVLPDEEAVRSVRPDMARLREAEERSDRLGCMVTARGAGEAHFVSRFFAPREGIPEDPVTGSAHTVLGPYWADRLGRSAMRACQVSARVGWLDVELHGDRVHLIGQAVIVMAAKLRV